MKKGLSFIVLSGISLILLGMMGCASTQSIQYGKAVVIDKPVGQMDEMAPDPDIFKRVSDANFKEIQDYKKTSSVCFTRQRNHTPKSLGLSHDQRQIVGLEGSPDWERNFKNALGESVTEWLYWKKDYQLQFKEGVLVYAGPIEDLAKMVIKYGQPTKIHSSILAGGQQRVMFWYEKSWKVMLFNEGKLVNYQ